MIDSFGGTHSGTTELETKVRIFSANYYSAVSTEQGLRFVVAPCTTDQDVFGEGTRRMEIFERYRNHRECY